MDTYGETLGSAREGTPSRGFCRPAGASQARSLQYHAWGFEECCLDGKHLTLRKLYIEDGASLVLHTPYRQEEAWIVTRGQVDVHSSSKQPQAGRGGVIRANPGEAIHITACGPVTLLAVSSHKGQGGTLFRRGG